MTDWSQHIDCFFHNFGMSVGVADVSIQQTTVNNVSVRFFDHFFPFFYFLNFSFSLVSIFLIEGFTQFKNLSSRSLSEGPLAYCKTSMAILEPHGGQCGTEKRIFFSRKEGMNAGLFI